MGRAKNEGALRHATSSLDSSIDYNGNNLVLTR